MSEDAKESLQRAMRERQVALERDDYQTVSMLDRAIDDLIQQLEPEDDTD